MAYSRTQTAARGARPARPARKDRPERSIFGVPERFMKPRLVLIAVTFVLTAFGLLMVYSASSITSLVSDGNAAALVIKQAQLGAVGAVLAVVLAFLDYHLWIDRLFLAMFGVSVILLILVFTPFAGQDALGASRWINIAGLQLQPSEFVKIAIVLMAAKIAQQYFEDGLITFEQFLLHMGCYVGFPLVLIVAQPDKGSTMIMGLSLLMMGYLAGFDGRLVGGVAALAGVGFLAYSLLSSYSRQRFLTMLDPWTDPYKTGYQLIQGWYGFASGGLTGVGIGFSRAKYGYLPLAYNDFIYAIIGEECGFVGTVGLLVLFFVFAWAGFKIAQHASDLSGRLIASGLTCVVVFQMLLNVAGITGVFPMSGKPIPFISYGGTSILASMLMVGFIVSVSTHSRLPETSATRARRSFSVAEGADGDGFGGGVEPGGPRGFSLVGEPEPRSARPRGGAEGTGRVRERSRSGRREDRASGTADGGARREGGAPGRGFTVVDGGSGRGSSGPRAGSRGAGRTPSAGRELRGGSERVRGRVTTDASGRRRIDLGPSGTERLRGRDRRR